MTKIKLNAETQKSIKPDNTGTTAAAAGETCRLEQELEISTGFIQRFSKGIGESNAHQSQLELHLSLHCFAKVATKRLFDIIPMLVRDVLVLKPSAQMSEMMHSACSDDELVAALAEDSTKAKKRASLLISIKRLEKSTAKLSALR